MALAAVGGWMLFGIIFHPITMAQVDHALRFTPENIRWANRLLGALALSFFVVSFDGLLRRDFHSMSLIRRGAVVASYLTVVGFLPAWWMLARPLLPLNEILR